MAQDKTNKEEGKKDDLTAKAIVNEGDKKEKNPAQKMDHDIETDGVTTSSAEREEESQEDEMVTESMDIIKDASVEKEDEATVPDGKLDENLEQASNTLTETQKEIPKSTDKQVDGTPAAAKITENHEQPEETSQNTSIKVDESSDSATLPHKDENSNEKSNAYNAVDSEDANINSDNNAFAKAEQTENKPEETAKDRSTKADETSSKSAEKEQNITGKKTATVKGDDEDFAEEEQDEDTSGSDDIDSALTEDSEDETTAERHSIPKKEYDQMSKEALIKEFKYLLHKHKIQAIKEHVDELRSAFISQFEEEQDEARDHFIEEGGNIIDFRYYNPLKKEFNTLYFQYRDKRNAYFKNLKRDLNANLDVRNALIEELKELKGEVGGEDSINTTFDKFRDIQERWRSAGNIPRDRYNLVWNNYHHHVENFYDFLHLNREFRDRDFKENLDKKMKLVEQAEELTKAQDINRAFKELQLLHKMWKEEIGPVAREYREEIWEKFSAATRSIHDSRQEYFKNIDKIHEENLVKKQEVIQQIEEIAAKEEQSHGAWQKAMKKVAALRDEFFKIGKVPRKKTDAVWKAFKKATRTFNRNKNAFYKNQKKEQQENLSKKMELVKIAEENKDNEDLEPTIELMKKIQSDWKKIGHIPRRDSDKVWKRFKKACNHVFDRLHANKKEALEEEQGNLEVKQEMLKKAKSIEITGKRDEDLAAVKALIASWKETGRVPFSQKGIEKDFNKILDGLFNKLDLGRKETEMIKYDNRVAAMADRDDDRQIEKERYFISKKVDEVKAEINQLENNLGFFQHVPDDNPMVKEVHKNIADHKKTLEIWKAKLKKIKTIA